MRHVRVYLDHVAGAPLSEPARETFLRLLASPLANPSSPHLEGRAAKDLLEESRSRVAAAIGCRAREIVFTSGATEACAIALRGAAARAAESGRRRIVVSAVEYAVVLETADALAEEGFEVVRVPVDTEGRIAADAFLEAAGTDSAVAALMLANHEIGSVMPVRQVAEGLAPHGTPLLCDAALAPGRLPATSGAIGAPLIAYSAQKFGGPAGAGFLYTKRGTRLAPWLRGGLQEERLRPGTENVMACAALAAALEPALAEQPERAARDHGLITTFLDGLADMPDWSCVGPPVESDQTRRLPGFVTLEIKNVEGEAVMINMDLEGFSIGTGSTCALGSTDPSPGLLAMGFSKSRAASTIRVSVGEGITDEHMKRCASTLVTIVSRLRALAHR